MAIYKFITERQFPRQDLNTSSAVRVWDSGVLKIQIALVEQQGLNLGNAQRGAVILRDQPIEHPCDVSTDVEGINFRIGIGGLGNYLGFELPLPNKSGFEINARTSRRKHAYSKKPEQSLNTKELPSAP